MKNLVEIFGASLGHSEDYTFLPHEPTTLGVFFGSRQIPVKLSTGLLGVRELMKIETRP